MACPGADIVHLGDILRSPGWSRDRCATAALLLSRVHCREPLSGRCRRRAIHLIDGRGSQGLKMETREEEESLELMNGMGF